MSKPTPSNVTAKIVSAPKKKLTVLLVDNKSAHLERLKHLTEEKLGSVRFVLRDPRFIDDKDVKGADLILFSGGWGRSIVKNPQTFRQMVEHAVIHDKPAIGICLGAEAIAVYYGSVLREIPVRRVGNVRLSLDESFARKLGFDEPEMMAYEFHKWMIKDVNAPLIPLATSKDGIEIFRHKRLPIWGLQFHPEVRRKNNSGHLVFEHILKSFGLLP